MNEENTESEMEEEKTKLQSSLWRRAHSGRQSAGKALRSALGSAGRALGKAGRATSPYTKSGLKAAGKGLISLTKPVPVRRQKKLYRRWGMEPRRRVSKVSRDHRGINLSIVIGSGTRRTRRKAPRRRRQSGGLDFGGFL